MPCGDCQCSEVDTVWISSFLLFSGMIEMSMYLLALQWFSCIDLTALRFWSSSSRLVVSDHPKGSFN